MSIRHVLSTSEMKQLSRQDTSYLKQQIQERTILNTILNKPVNYRILMELQRLLDNEAIARQQAGRYVRGQVSRLSDGMKHPVKRWKMTPEECKRYGIDPAVLRR